MSERRPLLPLPWLRGIALVLLAWKLLLLLVTPPFMDEAYYFLWGQHPGLSYFDHPPLNAWILGLSGAVFGWTPLALRLPVALSLIGDLWLLALFARRLAPEAPAETFWLGAVLFLATPVFFGLTGLALPDHLLVFFGLAAVYGLHGFLTEWDRGGSGLRLLYAGAVALGLAGLSKYNGVFIGIGFLALVALVPRWRPLLGSLHLWAAMGLALLMQAPVLWWNLEHGFASFDFIVAGRHGGQSNAAALSGLVGFVLGMVGLLGPLLMVPLARFLLARAPSAPADGLGRAVFWASSLTILGASLLTDVLFHWNLAAYIAVVPFLALHLRHRFVLVGQVVYGAVAALLAFVNYSVVPVMALISWTDQTTAWSYGWADIALRVEAVAAAQAPDFVAATDYTLASQLAFALGDREVTSLAIGRDQFDFWPRPGARPEASAIILADDWRPLGEIAEAFEEVVPVESLRVERFGRLVGRYRIYLGTGYRGGGGCSAPAASC